MIENEVRAAFSRYDAGGIDLDLLRTRITQESAQRRKRRGWARAGIAAAVAAIALATAPALVNNALGLAPLTGVTDTGPVNVLLLGLDEQGHSAGIVLVHLNATRSKVYLYSIPRDSVVDLPDGTPGRLGDQLTGIPDWVSRHHGLDLDGVARMDLDGLETMVQSLGQIEVCFERPSVSMIQLPGPPLPAGCQRLSGPAARDLVTSHGNNRDRAIQRVLAGLLAEIQKTVANPGKLHDLLSVSRVSVSGDLPTADLVSQLRGIQPSDVVGVAQPDGVAPVPDDEVVLALRNDRMDRFVAAHPDWVTRIRP
jgi:hypothetical protein